MKTRIVKRMAALLALILLAGLLTACGKPSDPGTGGSDTPAQTSAPAPAATSARTEEPAANTVPKHLNAASHMVGTSLDAAKNYQGWTVTRAGIGETLLKLNDAVELEACLADSWEWVDDYTLKLHVREGVTFQNG